MQKIRNENCLDCGNYRCIDCEPEVVDYMLDEDRQTVAVHNCNDCSEYDCEYWDDYNTRLDESQIESFCLGCC